MSEMLEISDVTLSVPTLATFSDGISQIAGKQILIHNISIEQIIQNIMSCLNTITMNGDIGGFSYTQINPFKWCCTYDYSDNDDYYLSGSCEITIHRSCSRVDTMDCLASLTSLTSLASLHNYVVICRRTNGDRTHFLKIFENIRQNIR